MHTSLVSTSRVAFEVEQKEFLCSTAEHQMVVQMIKPLDYEYGRLPIVMLHGGFHSGTAYLQCPDGRYGWAYRFAEHGHCVYVPDWPAHGKSPGIDRITDLGTLDIAHSIAKLLETTGRAIVLAHSASGPIAWWLTEHFTENVAAIIGIAPGSPANLLPALPDDPQVISLLQNDETSGYPVYSKPGLPVKVDVNFIRSFWANSPLFPSDHLDEYVRTIGQESPKLLNERFNIGGKGLHLSSTKGAKSLPILIVTGELDLRHPRETDAALARYLDAEHLWLPDAGIKGNGHMLMLEKNSNDIADLLIRWLKSKGY